MDTLAWNAPGPFSFGHHGGLVQGVPDAISPHGYMSGEVAGPADGAGRQPMSVQGSPALSTSPRAPAQSLPMPDLLSDVPSTSAWPGLQAGAAGGVPLSMPAETSAARDAHSSQGAWYGPPAPGPVPLLKSVSVPDGHYPQSSCPPHGGRPAVHLYPAADPAAEPQGEASWSRKADGAALRGLLKLDVHMGFSGDAKLTSPTTMLQPMVLKRGRASSDVGPRTPSLYGPAGDSLTSPVDDVSYLVQSMGGRSLGLSSRELGSAAMGFSASDTGLSLDGLSLDRSDEGQGARPASVPASTSPMALSSSQQTPSASDSVAAPLGVLPTTDRTVSPSMSMSFGEPTVNPTLVQSPAAAMMDQSLAHAMGDPAMYLPPLNSQEEATAGPMRTSTSGRTSRSVSPYPGSTRSLTPDMELSHGDAQLDATLRMAQWRFPGSTVAGSTGQTLHPMDAYTPGWAGGRGAGSDMSRPVGWHRAGRRHNRAAVSEDLRAPTRVDDVYPWASSMDFTHTGTNSLLMPVVPSRAMAEVPGAPQGGLRVPPVSSPSLQSTPALAVDFAPDAPLMGLDMRAPSMSDGATPMSVGSAGEDMSLTSVPALGSAAPADERTPTDTSGELDSPPHVIRPASMSRGASLAPDLKDEAIQMASQTHTPIVTTTAAQAASASRRKAEALFTCPFPDCGSTFTRQYNLRGHMRSHMDERPFKCDWPGCGRSFARTHDCKRHHNLHLNIKPYQCDGCGKTFARLDALNRHHKSEASSCGAKASEGKPTA